jgi:peptide-methionine (R)-S-oxide reductase
VEPADPSELRQRLTPVQWHVTQEAGTERAFSGEYDKHFDPGLYECVCCGAPLFTSDAKYDSGCGWPAYWEPVSQDAVRRIPDRSHGMVRTEVRCGTCNAHLGHVFEDGPRDKTGERFCINSASLGFRRAGAD